MMREMLLPRFTIRTFLAVVAIVALFSVVLGIAVQTEHPWAAGFVALVGTFVVCFVLYLVAFLLCSVLGGGFTSDPPRSASVAGTAETTLAESDLANRSENS